MHLKKKECLLRKIKLKNRGSIQWVNGFFFLLLLTFLLCAELQRSVWHSAGLYLEDALAASNLASAVIDVEEYGISHRVKISNVWAAYELYKDAVKGNLQLNDSWECANSALIAGPVIIESYIVYNVDEDGVNIYQVASGGGVTVSQGVRGSVRAPNGKVITATSVYSEISFPVKGIWGISAQAHKGKLVDIVSCGNGERSI